MYRLNTNKKLSIDQIKKYVNDWKSSNERRKLMMYKKYYIGDNESLGKRVRDRAARNKTPNNSVPTAYYTTVVDSMAGYMFNDVKYTTDGDYQEIISSINEINKQDVKDMQQGIRALAYNRAVELVYADKNAVPRFVGLEPDSVALVYDESVEPELFCAIWIGRHSGAEEYIDVIYKDEWQYYRLKSGRMAIRQEPKTLYFDSCPVVVYETQIIGDRSPFHQAIPYIDAIDILITGNSNEVDRLVDALLVIGKRVSPEDREHMDEWKTLEGMKNEDRAEYLTKDMSPLFREYVSKLLIQEIHKHCHVVDWYNPDTGLSGAASGKALKTRLFDMDMYSKRIEKMYKSGAHKRISLIGDILKLTGVKIEPVTIKYNRDTINDFESKIDSLSRAVYLSTRTKVEETGLDWTIEKARLADEEKQLANSYATGFTG